MVLAAINAVTYCKLGSRTFFEGKEGLIHVHQLLLIMLIPIYSLFGGLGEAPGEEAEPAFILDKLGDRSSKIDPPVPTISI